MNRQEKLQAIANYLDVDPSYFEEEGYDPNIFESKEYNESYVVLTEEEAREYAKRDIESVFDDLGLDAFKPRFQEWILNNAVEGDFFFFFGEDDFNDAVKEGRVDINMDKVVDKCISMDGIAHFVARYDGKEIDLGNGLYAYRVD